MVGGSGVNEVKPGSTLSAASTFAATGVGADGAGGGGGGVIGNSGDVTGSNLGGATLDGPS